MLFKSITSLEFFCLPVVSAAYKCMFKSLSVIGICLFLLLVLSFLFYVLGDYAIRLYKFRTVMLPPEWILFSLHPSLSLVRLPTLKSVLFALSTPPASFGLVFTWE